MAKVAHTSAAHIEQIEPPIARADPQLPLRVDQQRAHRIAGERAGVVRIVAVLRETVTTAVVTRHAAAVGPDPEIAASVLGEARDGITGETMGIAALAAV